MISPSPCLFYWESFVANVVYTLSIQVLCINMVEAQILWMKSGTSGALTLSANIIFHFQQRRMEPAVHIYYTGTFPFFHFNLNTCLEMILICPSYPCQLVGQWHCIRFSQCHNSRSGSLFATALTMQPRAPHATNKQTNNATEIQVSHIHRVYYLQAVKWKVKGVQAVPPHTSVQVVPLHTSVNHATSKYWSSSL